MTLRDIILAFNCIYQFIHNVIYLTAAIDTIQEEAAVLREVLLAKGIIYIELTLFS